MKQTAASPPPHIDLELRHRYQRLWTLIESAIEAKIPFLLQETPPQAGNDSTPIDPASAIRLLESAVRSLARAQECRMKLMAASPPASEPAAVAALGDIAPIDAHGSNVLPGSAEPQLGASIRTNRQDILSLGINKLVPSHTYAASRPNVENRIQNPKPLPPLTDRIPSSSTEPKIMTNSNNISVRSGFYEAKDHNRAHGHRNRSLPLSQRKNPPAPSNPSSRSRHAAAASPPPGNAALDTKALIAQLCASRGSYAQLREMAAVPI